MTIGGVIDYIKAKKRSKRDVKICFDEWNVWYHDRKEDGERIASWDWPEAPPLLEGSTISRMRSSSALC